MAFQKYKVKAEKEDKTIDILTLPQQSCDIMIRVIDSHNQCIPSFLSTTRTNKITAHPLQNLTTCRSRL